MARKKIDSGPHLFGFPDEDLKTSLHDEIVLWLKNNARDISIKLLDWKPSWSTEAILKERIRATEVVEKRKTTLEKEISEGEKALKELEGKGSIFKYQAEAQSRRLLVCKRELALAHSWPGLGDPPPPEIVVHTKAECPIQRQRYQATDIVGYFDIVFTIETTSISAANKLKDAEGNLDFDGDPQSYMCWHLKWRSRSSFAFDAKSSIPSFGELIRQFRTYEVFTKTPIYAVSPDSRFASDISHEGFGFMKYPDGMITFPKARSGEH